MMFLLVTCIPSIIMIVEREREYGVWPHRTNRDWRSENPHKRMTRENANGTKQNDYASIRYCIRGKRDLHRKEQSWYYW
jgi:hypothetical protein